MSKNLAARNLIIYAEDDEDDQQLVREYITQYAANTDILILNNGAEAVSYLDSLSASDKTPCLIILDINMPRMNGLEALKHIKANQRFANVPAILFTTSSQLQDKNFAARYNASFITKPIDSKQMKKIAEKFIEHCQQ